MTLGEKVQSILENLHWLTDEELRALERACGAELQERYMHDENGRAQAEGRGKPSGAKSPAPAATSRLRGAAQTVKCAACGGELDPAEAFRLDDGRRACKWCMDERFKLPELQALARREDGDGDGDEEVPF